ncbi:MAG: ATP-binding protein [Victivallaceae bacterium]|nr:ATP-binding protein [Victivallaceae bacterium]
MIARKIQTELSLLAREYKIVTITGPRQSGKTTLAKMQFPDYHYVNLEDPVVRRLAERDPRDFMKRNSAPLIVDEIQRFPELLSTIQVLADGNDNKGQYILTGSHQPALKSCICQSLAGRTAILELLPLSIEELAGAGFATDRDDLLFKGFMPQLYSEKMDPTRFYRNYYMTYVERDARQLANIRNLDSFELFIKLLAGRIGQLLNFSSLSNEIGISTGTLEGWLSILEASYIVFRLQPYYENFGKRLTKSPKIYFHDVGLAAYLLGIETPEMAARDPLMGNLFENMVVAEAIKARFNAGKQSNLYFFRDSNGTEIDLLLASGQKLHPMEIKSSRTWHPDFDKHIRKFRKWTDRSGKGAVIYAGEEEQSVDGISIVNFRRTSSMM